MTTRTPLIVIDTNVLISPALLPNSKTAQVLTLALEHFAIAQNEQTWFELESRIQRKRFDKYFDDEGRLRHLVRIAQTMVNVVPVANDRVVPTDADDDKFVRLALYSDAKIIISGDRDLKQVASYKGIEIMSPAAFFERYSELKILA
jgi:uncharacterized protein